MHALPPPIIMLIYSTVGSAPSSLDCVGGNVGFVDDRTEHHKLVGCLPIPLYCHKSI
jgi:hypothetical protein